MSSHSFEGLVLICTASNCDKQEWLCLFTNFEKVGLGREKTLLMVEIMYCKHPSSSTSKTGEVGYLNNQVTLSAETPRVLEI